MDFLAFSEPSSQNQWENDWADMNFKKIAIWTTLTDSVHVFCIQRLVEQKTI